MFTSSCEKKKCKACDSNKESKSILSISAAEVSSTTNCASVLPLIPDDDGTICCIDATSKLSTFIYLSLFFLSNFKNADKFFFLIEILELTIILCLNAKIFTYFLFVSDD